jgi:hypothetical protein
VTAPRPEINRTRAITIAQMTARDPAALLQ